MKTFLALLLCFAACQSVEFPFDYDLQISSIPGTNGRVMVCLHGYGGSYEIASTVKSQEEVEATLISFNFPEYGIHEGRKYDYRKATFGTIDELLPALYVLKQVVIDQGFCSIDLYGFSAGGGALINMISVLNTSNHDERLKEIGIGALEKEKLLNAIQQGVVILDVPLKSIEEIIDFKGWSEEFDHLAKNYRNNHLRPIDSLAQLKGLSLDILLYFQANDEILSNRDDAIYIENLKATQSYVTVITGNDRGHMGPHSPLWNFYFQKMSQ